MAEQKNAKSKTRERHRYLSERIVITGQLTLTRPAHFGNGDADELTDLPLLVDEIDGRALLTGASLAGALRNYLRERQWGYELPMPSRDSRSPYYREWTETENDLLATKLFGGHRGDESGDQSPLIVDDALSTAQGSPEVELRDGVAIDATTRTAAEDKKYDFELLAAGTKFGLRFELLLDDQPHKNKEQLKALALALRGLGNGEIRLGARKRRGFGCCEVKQWTVTRYRLQQPDELLAWLTADHPDWVQNKPASQSGSDIAALLGVLSEDLKQTKDRRETFEIEADFALDGSMLVRAGFDEQDRGPDTVHLHTYNAQRQQSQAVLPGTSIAGAIRQRAQRIANTLAGTDPKARKGVQVFIDRMFGPAEIKGGDQARASRVIVNEEFIKGGRSLVQTRIKIDRFTQGTMETALLEEAPHFGGSVKLRLTLNRIPNEQSEAKVGFNQGKAEIGLLLLVLKDLWLGDLPLGGASSVGRGRLKGTSAKLRWKPEKREPLTLNAAGLPEPRDTQTITELESYVQALQQVNWAALSEKKEDRQ
ncbi:MAG: RAMP superfamily CRISPR-associated protein [Acidobacteriota bacterium]|nr:RAMP superfamily CRISPR-associated protein [Acidobacteriota bacterium]